MGVYLQTVDPSLAGQLGLPPDTEGAAVVEVVRDGPAADAGLEAGDVITAIGGKPVASDLELIKSIAALRPGGRGGTGGARLLRHPLGRGAPGAPSAQVPVAQFGPD